MSEDYLPGVLGHAVPSELFTLDRSGVAPHFVSELSDIRPHLVLRRLWSNSTAPGFAMRSSRTGVVVVFELEHIERDRRGAPTVLRYKVVNPPAGMEGARASVFND